MTNAIIAAEQTGITQSAKVDAIKRIVLDTVSERSQRDYGRALDGFLGFMAGYPYGLNKAAVQSHVSALQADGVTAASINQRLAAIRKFALEAADNGLIDEQTAQAIKRVKNIKRSGRKLGNWLTQAQAEQMINAPDANTVKGQRDRALLAVAIGCGLRREEMASLRLADIAQREGRWVILDLEGKHGRTRTVPMAAWVKATIDRWAATAGLQGEAYLFPPMRRGDNIQGGHMSAQAVWKVVAEYAPVENLAPHDLRRTFAKLAHSAGAPIEQIQQSLGHASIQTTERYLGVDLDLQNAPSDFIRLNVE